MADPGPVRRTRKRPDRSCLLSLPERIFDGYKYYYGKQLANGERRLFCSKDKTLACHAAGKLSSLDEFSYCRGRDTHNHEPDLLAECKSRFRRDLFKACRHQFRHLKLIYDDVSLIHQEAAALLSFVKMRINMEAWKKIQELPVISSATSFYSYLRSEDFTNINLHNTGKIEVQFLSNNANKYTAIIFADKQLLEKVDTSILFIQSTVEVLPEDIGGIQSTLVSTHHTDYIFPIIWIIEFEKSEENCKKIVASMLNLKTAFVPREIYGDFDDNYFKAFNSFIPNINMEGTLGSYCNIMVDAANRFNLHLRDEVTLAIFSKIIGTSLLPSNQLMEAFRLVISSMTEEQFNLFEEFLEFFNTSWLSGISSEQCSFYKCPTALWKHSDLIIIHMTNSFRNRPNIWNFMEQVLSSCEQCDYHAKDLLRNGRTKWNTNKIKNIFNGTKNFKSIDKLWQDLENGSIDIKIFLERISTSLVPVVQNLNFVRRIIPPQFKLLRLAGNEHVVIPVKDIRRTPNDALQEVAISAEPGDVAQPPNIDDELPPGLADVELTENESTNHADEEMAQFVEQFIAARSVTQAENEPIEVDLNNDRQEERHGANGRQVEIHVDNERQEEEHQENERQVEIHEGNERQDEENERQMENHEDNESHEEEDEDDESQEEEDESCEGQEEADEYEIGNAIFTGHCLMCLVREANMLYKPCKHVAACYKCNKKWYKVAVDQHTEFHCIACRTVVENARRLTVLRIPMQN